MQVVIVEQNYTFHNGKILHHWNVQILRTGKIVARINWTGKDGECQLVTYGNHPGGNRYRSFDSIETVTEVVLKWASRRFRDTRKT